MSIVQERRRRKPEINVIPLVDVLIVLIFFFLMSMQFRNMATLNIVPPEIETAGTTQQQKQIEIAVSPEGELYYNGEQMTQAEIATAIELAASANRNLSVLLLADEESYLRYVTFVLDTCRKHGLENIRLQSR